MGVHVNLRHPLSVAGTLVMALPAKFPFIRLGRYYRPRRGFMLFRGRVAHGAGNSRVIRCHLGPFNLRMAGRAGTRCLGWCGVMGIMTGNTGLPGIMRDRVNLRKAGRPGRVVVMAVTAVISFPG